MHNLKKKRMEAGLTQLQLAEVSGVPVRLIRNYEAEAAISHRNINNAGALSVWRLAQALECEVIDILEVDENGDALDVDR